MPAPTLTFCPFSYSWCSDALLTVFGLGINIQLTPVDTRSPTRIGCMTLTPAVAEMTPVMMGKTEPPICANTKTMANAVACISLGNSFEPRLMPYGDHVSDSIGYAPS